MSRMVGQLPSCVHAISSRPRPVVMIECHYSILLLTLI
jgi:hypothetical protein